MPAVHTGATIATRGGNSMTFHREPRRVMETNEPRLSVYAALRTRIPAASTTWPDHHGEIGSQAMYHDPFKIL
jgi:hypothetical protein